ncbi:MAG: alpha/beta hydrolase family protein [Bryobacteraceae bacterium]
MFAGLDAEDVWQLDENWRIQIPELDEAELRALLRAQAVDGQLSADAENMVGAIAPAQSVWPHEQISRVHAPLMVIHGDADEIVPFSQGKAVFTLLTSRSSSGPFQARIITTCWTLLVPNTWPTCEISISGSDQSNANSGPDLIGCHEELAL